MAEETVRVRFMSHLNDGDTQRLLEEEAIYNLVLAARDCALG